MKASVSTLRQENVAWSADDRAALLATIEEGADRLGTLIGNLLDMSRIQTGALEPLVRESGAPRHLITEPAMGYRLVTSAVS